MREWPGQRVRLLRDMVAQLEHLVSRENSNIVLYVFGEVAQWEEMKGHPQLPDAEHVGTLRSWLSSLKARVNGRYDFDGLCCELGHLIYEYTIASAASDITSCRTPSPPESSPTSTRST